ncbi:unknown protein [Microcystis aeruginosa NIES-843]|uniref:Uncharacterized protein n=1 Tax=Microcystis aeruginosa (strain NIES-843 / IAM M-2473) TaxID=449447 RepID=B0JL36_MICAN|nr:unknown protein [Microcystis aeruginosa NIES-843]
MSFVVSIFKAKARNLGRLTGTRPANAFKTSIEKFCRIGPTVIHAALTKKLLCGHSSRNIDR